MAVMFEKKGDKLLLHSSNIPSAWSARVVPRATGLLLLCGLVSFIWAAWQMYQLPTHPQVWMLPLGIEMVSGFLAFLTLRQTSFPTENIITLDRESGLLRYGQQGYRGKLEVPLAYAEELVLLQQENDQPSGPYQVFLIWENHAMWWLWESYDTEEVDQVVRLLADHLRLPLRDLTDLNLDQPGGSGYLEADSHSTLKTSIFYEEARLHGTLNLGLRYPRNWLKRIAGLLVVLGPTLALGFWSFRQWESHDHQANLWLAGTTLMLASVLVATMIFWSEKRYQLSLKAAGLNIVLNFGNRLLNLLLKRKVTIPESVVQEIRLHRLPGGYFRLTVGLDEEFQVPVVRNPFFNAGVFRRKPSQVSQANLHEVNIWEVAPFHDPKNGPYLGDLVALQTALHRQYLTRNGVRIQLYNER